jgi:hypothetical protein
METVTIPKSEYQQLINIKGAYQKLVGEFYESIVDDPIEEVVKDFTETELYSAGFLQDLEAGLRKSSYTNNRK